MADKRPNTAYHILKRTSRRNPEGSTNVSPPPKDTFELVMQNLEASSAETAIRTFATGPNADANVIEGSYLAVPSRSFVEKTVKVETRKQVTLA